MAMYKLSDVVLDSVYFGGDTTTREAFEVGSPVITLPGKTIGQRWTQAYYRVMGIKDFIARTVDEYVQIAVKAANASDKQKSNTRARIKKALHKKLFKNADAPRLWGDAIMSALQKPKRWHWNEAEPLKQHDEL
jgi:predicted O-linked N-acetylglucosamine transferase (SPINDLY family)